MHFQQGRGFFDGLGGGPVHVVHRESRDSATLSNGFRHIEQTRHLVVAALAGEAEGRLSLARHIRIRPFFEKQADDPGGHRFRVSGVHQRRVSPRVLLVHGSPGFKQYPDDVLGALCGGEAKGALLALGMSVYIGALFQK